MKIFNFSFVTKIKSFVSYAPIINKEKFVSLEINKLHNRTYTSLEEYSSYFQVKDGDKKILEFNIQQLPGCCGVCVLHYVSVSYNYLNKGYGKLIFEEAKGIARQMGYSAMLCTTVEQNISTKIANKTNWITVFKFRNWRTNNLVNLHYVVL